QAYRLHRLVILQQTRLPLQHLRWSDERFRAMAAIIAWNRARRSTAQSPRKDVFLACVECRHSMALALDSITSWKYWLAARRTRAIGDAMISSPPAGPVRVVH